MADITLVGSGSTVASGGNPTINKPAGTTSGDVILITCGTYVDAVTTPSGFTKLVDVQSGAGGTDARCVVFRKVAGGSEPSSYSLTCAGYCDCDISVWRTVDNTTPEDATSTTNSGTATTETAPSITTVTDRAMVVLVFHGQDGCGSSVISGWTQDLNYDGVPSSQFLYHKLITPAAASGTQTISGASGDGWATAAIALRPASTAAARPPRPVAVARQAVRRASYAPR